MNFLKTAAAAACTAIGVSACAPVTTSGPPLALSPERAAASRVDVIYFSNGWVRAEEDFADDVTDELRDGLNRCARGPAPLHLRVHVNEVDREDRLTTVLNGGGEHWISGFAEFVDPSTKTVVGRYPFGVTVDAGGPVQAILANRQMLLGQGLASQLCREAFGAG